MAIRRLPLALPYPAPTGPRARRRPARRLASARGALLASALAALCACGAPPRTSPGAHASASVHHAQSPAVHGGAALPAAAGAAALPPLPRLVEPEGSLAAECAARRARLAERLGPGVALVFARSGEDLDRFFQADDFYYLSGVEIPGISLALRVDESGRLADEVLFLPPHDPLHETWNGPRLSPGPAAERATGFRRTAPLETQEALLAEWDPAVIHVHGEPAFALPDDAEVGTGAIVQALHALRLVKSQHEIDCLTNAIEITCAALHRAVAAVRPGAFEYEPQGALEGAFLAFGAERPGFASILGSGPNSVTLHYNANRRQMQAGELIVMDVGAKWRYYCADVTRTVPVSGRFTPRQREVYELVLAAQTAAAEAAKPGITMRELDAIARDVIEQGGFGPGRRYFQHGLGHWIGLDVHDVGGSAPIVPGTLFTIEPGIYIADEALGVRIEDDYLMTADGAVKLSTGIPSDPDAIEALMAARRL